MEVRKQELKEILVTIESYTICDKCDTKIETTESYESFECEFVFKDGFSYPDSGYHELTTIQLCKDCGLEAINLLKDNGFKSISKEVDY